MATLPAIKGALLEEAILYFLRASGYKTIDANDVRLGNDPTLQFKPNTRERVIEVRGRGCAHQIDAIADCLIPRAFSNPQRLLVEAKYHGRNIEVEVIRNAVGVHRDVSEFFNIPYRSTTEAQPIRYHYQCAVFSASPFSRHAQEYAYAHDVYLLPLQRSAHMQPVLQILARLSPASFGVKGNERIDIPMEDLRWAVRSRIRDPYNDVNELAQLVTSPDASEFIDAFCRECRKISIGLLAMVDRKFPIFLTPSPRSQAWFSDLRNDMFGSRVAIRIRQGNWFLQLLDYENIELSFDLPARLLELYSQQGHLPADSALRLKQQHLSLIQAFLFQANAEATHFDAFRMLTFQMDQDWFASAQSQLDQQRRPRRFPNG